MRLNLDRTFNVDCAVTFSGTSIYEFHCKRFAMEHIVATATTDPDTLLFNSMSFYRSNPDTPFSEKDRSFKEVLFPHLIAAVQTNWLTNLPHLLSANQRSTFNSIAACDTYGVLRLAMPSFVETCRKEWPEWKGPRLPECVQESMRDGALKFAGKHIVVSMFPLDDLLLLRARPITAADDLSPRELEVAQRFAAGVDYKTIAQELTIAPSTVKVYLNKIYTKLDIHEKSSLAAKLRQMTH
jgi:DNA-binding CsgD family transcriptional regulator